MKISSLILFLVFVAIPAFAQHQQVYTVRVSYSGPAGEPIGKAVEARLKATTRYMVVSQDYQLTDMGISLLCMPMRSKDHSHIYGYACRYDFYSNKGVLGSDQQLIVGPDDDISYFAETIFQDFVDATTNSKLAEDEAHHHALTKLYCQAYPGVCTEVYDEPKKATDRKPQ